MPEFIYVSSFEKSTLPEELKLYSIQYEPQLLHYYEPLPGLFIAESPKVIERALAGGYEPVSLLMYNEHVSGEAADLLKDINNIPVYLGDEEKIADIIGFKLIRGPLCAMKRKTLPSPESIVKGKKRIAVLENVTNPTNIGAVFRSAAALGMEAVLLTDNCCDPLYRRSSRVSMGTVFQVPWTYTRTDLADTDELRKLGFSSAAMALIQNSIGIDDEKLIAEEKLAVILGNEGYGLDSSTIERADYTVYIPMYNDVDSLNVAASSAVAFWQLGKRSV